MAGGSMHLITFDQLGQIGNECVPPSNVVAFGETLEG